MHSGTRTATNTTNATASTNTTPTTPATTTPTLLTTATATNASADQLCMPVGYQCTRHATAGRHSGKALHILPKSLSPGGTEWLPQDCAMECAAIADCVHWLVRPRPDMQCVIKSKKSKTFSCHDFPPGSNPQFKP